MEADNTDEAGQKIWDELAAEEESKPAPEHTQPPEQETQPDQPKQDGQEPQDAGGQQGEKQRPEYIAALEKQVAELTNLVKSTVGRVGSLQSELSKLHNVAAHAPTQAQQRAAAGNPERWAKLKEEFPEWGEAIEEFVMSRAVPGTEDILKSVQQIADERVTAATIRTAKAIASIAEPDWESVVESDEFDTWLRKQPAEYVSAAAEASAAWDAPRVVAIVRDFKKQKQSQRATNSTSQSRLAAAEVPTGSTASRRRTEELDGKAYWDELARQERARS